MAILSKVTSSFEQSEIVSADLLGLQPSIPNLCHDIDTDSEGTKLNNVGCSGYGEHAQANVEIQAPGRLAFRNYQMFPTARLLLRNGGPVNIGSRAFDLLHILVCSRGKLVSKSSILQYVWPDTYVDESNLRFQMGSLRKALGPDRNLIITIPGRGYLFAEDISNP